MSKITIAGERHVEHVEYPADPTDYTALTDAQADKLIAKMAQSTGKHPDLIRRYIDMRRDGLLGNAVESDGH